MIKVSAILPAHNRAHTLRRALDSIAAQTYAVYEIVVVDDGSTDHTADLVAEWTRDHHLPVRSYRTENRGVSAARNLGARQARGDWLAFLDSDDEWLPPKIERQVPLTASHDWIHGEENWFRDGLPVRPHRKHAKSGGRIFKRCVEICCVSPSTVLIRRERFLAENGFREDFVVCEDYELWLRLSARIDAGFVAEPVVNKYGGHADQLSHRYKAMDAFRARALVPFLENPYLSTEERRHVARTLEKMCAILIKGFLKYQNFSGLDQSRVWQELARNALNANQIAHSVTERRPRSESTAIL